MEGNSPNRKNEVNIMNIGVNDKIGTAKERSKFFNALKKIKTAITLRKAVEKTDQIN